VRAVPATAVRATCACRGTTILIGVGGILVCSACASPIVSSTATTDSSATTYGSKLPHAPPPGRSYAWFRKNAAKMPGVVRTGGVRGRSVVWTIAATAFRAWLATQQQAVVPPSPKKNAATSAANDDEWIKASGYRLTQEG